MVLEDTGLKERYGLARKRSEFICSPLAPEDHVVQPIVDVSPPKWHLGHTTWFFETFILQPHLPGYTVFNDHYSYVFNSYYESVGKRVIRTNRGNLTRPTTEEILTYRKYVDEHMSKYFDSQPELNEEVLPLIELGIQHEQQHQELLCYDIKYILGNNPLFPVYKNEKLSSEGHRHNLEADWLGMEAGLYTIGHQGDTFCFDNELGVHQVYLHAYQIMDRVVTNAEYLEFISSGGYTDFRFWLSEAWDWVNTNDIKSPLYWHFIDGMWYEYTLNGGLQLLDLQAPVTHISFYEADAYAKWKGMRLPTEFEWEVACLHHGRPSRSANFVDSGRLHPTAAGSNNNQFYGDVWEWTNSAYLPYPYYEAPEGAVGEYNGKFMISQMVLRGGSCATPFDHIRATYRNFFHPHLRWMFSGIRLAQTIK